MELIEYISPRPIKVNEVICWRVGDPREEYDFSKIERYGDIVLRIECTDGVCVLIVKHPEKGGEMLNNPSPKP